MVPLRMLNACVGVVYSAKRLTVLHTYVRKSDGTSVAMLGLTCGVNTMNRMRAAEQV